MAPGGSDGSGNDCGMNGSGCAGLVWLEGRLLQAASVTVRPSVMVRAAVLSFKSVPLTIRSRDETPHQCRSCLSKPHEEHFVPEGRSAQERTGSSRGRWAVKWRSMTNTFSRFSLFPRSSREKHRSTHPFLAPIRNVQPDDHLEIETHTSYPSCQTVFSILSNTVSNDSYASGTRFLELFADLNG